MAEQVANVPVAPEVEPEQNVESPQRTYREIVRELLANGARKINKLKVKNINFTEKENYTAVGITFTTKVPGFTSNDNGMTYEKGMTNTIFVSLFSLVSVIKENEDLAWMGNKLSETPNILPLIFCGAELSIMQREYAAGTEVVNPFSTRTDVVAPVYDHDIIVNDVVDIELGTTGKKMADKLADKMLGF